MNSSLSSLFTYLKENNINYFLLTDFESDLTSNDIDLFVYPNDRQAFENALFKLGWYRRKEPAFHINHHFYISPNSKVYLDVKYELTFANSPSDCFSFDKLNTTKSQVKLNSKGVCRPYGMNAIILYAAHLAYKERGKLEDKHRTYLLHFIELYKYEIDEVDIQVVVQINDWLDKGFPGNTIWLQKIIAPYFVHSKQPMTRPGNLKYGYGLNVLFLGTDGSGKTTLVEAVKDSLNIKNNKLYLGAGEDNWTSHAMKSIYQYSFTSKPFKKIHNLLKSYMVMPLELSLRILPVIRKSKYHVTLIDRFPGFVYLDKHKVRSYIYKFILPKPDLVFFLYASPEVLVKRKPNETTIERSLYDMKRFENVAKLVSNGNYKRIDTSDLTVDEARRMIIDEIYKHPKVYQKLLTTESEY